MRLYQESLMIARNMIQIQLGDYNTNTYECRHVFSSVSRTQRNICNIFEARYQILRSSLAYGKHRYITAAWRRRRYKVEHLVSAFWILKHTLQVSFPFTIIIHKRYHSSQWLPSTTSSFPVSLLSLLWLHPPSLTRNPRPRPSFVARTPTNVKPTFTSTVSQDSLDNYTKH